MNKKSYEKPTLQILNYDISDITMGDLDLGGGSVTTGEDLEDGW